MKHIQKECLKYVNSITRADFDLDKYLNSNIKDLLIVTENKLSKKKKDELMHLAVFVYIDEINYEFDAIENTMTSSVMKLEDVIANYCNNIKLKIMEDYITMVFQSPECPAPKGSIILNSYLTKDSDMLPDLKDGAS